ncbi:hypothetical protein BJ875DRAFT_441854 [Amylocarpus encephaloides]|uniref:C6 zinc finger domain protein n=1 Tax=Amylocarpus encephaloides TaxID=45428 RepID=A0A9P7YHS3_9HELO|nr:hypothetical protein BJ875DRAFT_441854 [Amylocarpus encephaloides]
MTLRGRETPGFSRFDQIMLQLARSESTVWHSLQAIASMFYTLVEGENGHSPKQSHQKTLQHYNQAVRLLTSSNPHARSPIEVTLICCYVFFNIEILLKHEEGAISHLHGGMQILRNWKMNSRGQDAANYIILAPKFYSTVSFAFVTGRILSSSALLDEKVIYLPMRDHFSTVGEARISLLEITSLGLQSARAFEAYKIKRQVAIEDVGIVHEQAILRRLQDWFRIFDKLLAQMNTECLSAAKIHEIDVLRLSAKLALIWIPPRFSMNEMKYDDFVQDFKGCLHLAKSIYDQALNMVDTVNREFLRDHFQAVYMIILRCRNPIIRHDALEYLKSLRSEGFWQSSLMTRVAERAVDIEEEGPEKCRDSTGAPVPIESSRIHDINIIPLENDHGARMVRFRLRINWKWISREERFMLIPNNDLVPRPPPEPSLATPPASSQKSPSEEV